MNGEIIGFLLSNPLLDSVTYKNLVLTLRFLQLKLEVHNRLKFEQKIEEIENLGKFRLRVVIISSGSNHL
jgi:hypothetical protein